MNKKYAIMEIVSINIPAIPGLKDSYKVFDFIQLFDTKEEALEEINSLTKTGQPIFAIQEVYT